MVNSQVCRVAIPVPLRRTFDYLLPPDLLSPDQSPRPGCRVRVNFSNQSLVGIILALPGESELPPEKLKPVEALLDREPVLDTGTLALCQWAAHYYQHPIGEAIVTALPALLRQGDPASLPARPRWQLTTEGKGLPDGALSRAPKQAALLALLQSRSTIDDNDLKQQRISKQTLKALIGKGLVEAGEAVPDSDGPDSNDTTPPPNTALLGETPLTLNPEQQAALDQLRYGGFSTYLLEGTTGSGKTEVYLQAIQRVLEQQRQALVLVPEIGLTPQLIGRFQRRFQVPIATLHSGLNQRERLNNWLSGAQGKAAIVIGTRSAVFVPLPRLGVIIIDEEHDLSFKQQDGLRYSARDLAAVRAQRLGIPLLLGSATPSLESLYNAVYNSASHNTSGQTRYQHLRLTRRAGSAMAPGIELLDLRGQPLDEGLSQPLLDHIRHTLALEQQVLVFINRRGFAPTLMCRQCGWIAGCDNCSARLTVHRQPPHLHCHHCGHQRPLARQCPECRSRDLELLGQGTERSEEALRQHFPDTPIYRVDRDSTRRKDSLNAILNQVQSGEPCILVGTQMLAKGHHFPNVTLVTILDIDSGLFSADFRGPERMGQLLIQVAGRAGRADKPGTVVIQSYHCEHPGIQRLVNDGYHRYARDLLRERQLASLPPYRHLALIRAESKRADNAMEFLQTAARIARRAFPPSQQLGYLGPLPALMERKQDRFCFQLHISSNQRRQLHQVLRHICQQMENHALARRSRWSVDVDPLDMA